MIHIYICTMEYYSAINGHILFSPDESNQKEKNKYNILTYIYGI